MAEISILDLQNLRHLIGGYSTTHCKMTDYASQAEDPEIKKLFQDAADSAMKNKQELMKFLSQQFSHASGAKADHACMRLQAGRLEHPLNRRTFIMR